VLLGRGLCDELITRPEESYRLWYVVVCDLDTSRIRRPWPALGRSATKKNIYIKQNVWNMDLFFEVRRGWGSEELLKCSCLCATHLKCWNSLPIFTKLRTNIVSLEDTSHCVRLSLLQSVVTRERGNEIARGRH